MDLSSRFPYDDPSGGASPTNGGYLPATIGASLNDPWDTRYGYCAWDHGSVTSDCSGTGRVIAGVGTDDKYAIAIVSAGPDRQFQTTCNVSPAGDSVTKVSGSDDIILGYTYAEANTATAGLWTLSDPDTATLSRDIEIKDGGGTNVIFGLDQSTGASEFLNLKTATISSKAGTPSDGNVGFVGAVKLDSSATCNATNNDGIRWNATTDLVEYCDGSSWSSTGDNLGNHTATENIQLGAHYLSNDGDNEGIQVDTSGNVTTSANTTVSGTLDVTGATTLSSTLDVTGAADLSSTLTVDGDATLGDAVTDTTAITGIATVGDTLDVTGATTLSSTLDVTGDATFDTDTLFVDAANNRVGVGTTSPGHILTIDNASGAYINFLTGGSTVKLGSQGNGAAIYSSNIVDFYSGASAPHVTDGAAPNSSYLRMRIDAAGDVGIGDDAPDATLKLDVEGQVGATEYCDEDGLSCIDIADVISGTGISESDPQVGTLNVGGWCRSADGVDIDCDQSAPGGGGGDDEILDADGDTKVQVEESADEDKIRFDTAGTERMIIDADAVQVTSTPLRVQSVAGLATPLGMAGTDTLAGLSCSNNEIAKWNGSAWACAADGGGSSLWTQTGSDIYYSTGKVGIGTASPAYELHVTGTGTEDGVRVSLDNGNNVFLSEAGGVVGHNLYTSGNNAIMAMHAGGTEEIRFNTAGDSFFDGGNVGIGTQTPAHELDVRSATTPRIQVRADSGGGEVFMEADQGAIGKMGTSNNIGLALYTNNAEQVRIDTSGNVGIGTATVNAPLELSGPNGTDTGMFRSSYTVDQSYYREFGRNNSNGNFEIRRAQGGAATTDLSIDTAGNVGIGTASPGLYPLRIETAGQYAYVDIESTHASKNGAGLQIQNGGSPEAYVVWKYPSTEWRFYAGGATNSDVKMVIEQSGEIGIGTMDPGYELEVVGDIAYSGVLVDTSDRRMKDNILALESNDMLDKILKVEGVTFTMKDDPDAKTEYGVIAQNIEIMFPDLVKTADDEMKTKSVNYIGLIAPMIEAIKAQQAQIEALQAEIETLKNKGD